MIHQARQKSITYDSIKYESDNVDEIETFLNERAIYFEKVQCGEPIKNGGYYYEFVIGTVFGTQTLSLGTWIIDMSGCLVLLDQKSFCQTFEMVIDFSTII